MDKKRFLSTVQNVLHLFIFPGAVAGGAAAVLDPHAPLGISTELLDGSPFSSFLIPGLFLMLVIGLGNLAAFIVSMKAGDLRGYASGICGAIMVGWISIQCLILWGINVLHILYFLLGSLQGLLGIWFLLSEGKFPFRKLQEWRIARIEA